MTILILAKDGDRTAAGSLARAAAFPVSGAKSKKSADDTPVILKSVSSFISVGRQDTFSGRRCPFSERKTI